ncbi:MAG: DUF5131 family protein, partial [bacterium]
MSKTGISWADETWNPVVGCTHAGTPGCDHCYARELHQKRHKAYLAGKKMPRQYEHPFEVVHGLPVRLIDPLHWKAPRRIFVNSMGDLFHGDVSPKFRDRVFETIMKTQRHTYMTLTKRADRMWDYSDSICSFVRRGTGPMAIKNLWCGVTVENQAMADLRIPYLLETLMAQVKFLSIEPMLEPVTLPADFLKHGQYRWVIAGCESGPGRRPADADWFRALR